MNRIISIAFLLSVTGCGASSTAEGGLASDALTDALVDASRFDDLGGTEPGDLAGETSDSDGDVGPAGQDVSPRVEDVDEDAKEGPTKAELAAAREAFFSLDNAHLIEIELSEFALQALDAEPYEYVPGSIIVNGEVLSEVGVRLKGKWGSFRPLPEKSAFLVNFAKYDNDTRLHGMKKMALNNQVQDPSRMHEWLAYSLFREAGLAASRLTYTWVRLNDEDFGLYAAVEVVDNPHFLNQFFDDNDGQLYEGEYGTDLFGDMVKDFDHDGGKEDGKVALYELAAALDDIEEEPSEALAKLGAVIDMDAYLAFAATEIWVGHWDGYAWTRNNYFLYRPEEGEVRWSWIPWGLDQVFQDHLPPFGGQGRVTQLCNLDLDCRAQLAQHFMDVSERALELDLLGQSYALEELLWGAMTSDPLTEHEEGWMKGSIEQVREFVQERPTTILEGLECVDPMNVDEDNDGHSGCGADCDDGDPTVHPGAQEECNLRDDNCNGQVDEGGDCPTCVPQSLGGIDYLFCFQARPFDEAEADCVAQGGHLASVHDEDVNAVLWEAAVEIQGSSWWFGLHDQEVEGEYIWTDGTPFDFEDWGDGEPNDSGSEDCAHWADWSGGRWNDIPCDFEIPYVCQL